jgi:hypothetical protein
VGLGSDPETVPTSDILNTPGAYRGERLQICDIAARPGLIATDFEQAWARTVNSIALDRLYKALQIKNAGHMSRYQNDRKVARSLWVQKRSVRPLP